MNTLNIINGVLIVIVTGISYYAWLLWDENQSLKAMLDAKKDELLDSILENSTIQNRLTKIHELSK